jgi:two-component system, OmpR family, alkaline phosphatase synthesis response regulator PhoP
MSDRKKILVVDDEPDYCALIKKALEKEGFEVDIAYDGTECLLKVRSNPPDAIVLDIVMPEKDGRAVCRELKNSKHFCHIPILVLSAETCPVTSTRYARDRSLYGDADDFLPKPVSGEMISRNLKRLLARPQGDRMVQGRNEIL